MASTEWAPHYIDRPVDHGQDCAHTISREGAISFNLHDLYLSTDSADEAPELRYMQLLLVLESRRSYSDFSFPMCGQRQPCWGVWRI
jgi:hypothetical protein